MTVFCFILDTSPSMLRPFAAAAAADPSPIPSRSRSSNSNSTDNDDCNKMNAFGAPTSTGPLSTTGSASTSASCASQTVRLNCLDASKLAIEHVVRLFLRHSPPKKTTKYYRSGVKYALFTTARDHRQALQAGFHESIDAFLSVVERQTVQDDALQCDPAQAMSRALDYIHLYRMHHRMDNVGGGVYPMLGESTFIFYLTDGGPLVKCSAAEPKLIPVNQLPVAMSKLPGNEFFASAYRPDQRVIGWLLRPSGEVPEQTRSAETTIEAWLRINAAATGDSLTGMLFDRSLIGRSTWEGATIYQPSMGVTLRLDDEQMHVRENDSSQSSLVPMLIPDTIQPNGIVGSEGLLQWGHWPIPESAFFLLESTAPYYPRRPTAHSVIECSVTDIDWTARIPPGFPFKKFAFDNSHPLIQRLLTDGRDWICRVPLKMQGKTKISAPFGVIKANTAQTGLNLWLLPYDFPVLFELLEKHRSGGADLDWHRRMEGYLKAMPGYYRLPLKHALRLYRDRGPRAPPIALPAEYDDNDFHVANPTARKHYDACTHAASKEWLRILEQPKVVADANAAQVRNVFNLDKDEAAREWTKLSQELCSVRLRREMDGDEQRESNRVRPIVGPRNVRQAQEDTTHAVPQSKMGDFESYMLRNPPLRFAYEEEERLANLTMFGNPFKKLPGELVSPINDDQVDESGAATALKQVQVRRSRSMTTRDSRIGEPRKNASLALTEDVTRVSVEKWAECGKVHEEAIMRYRIADFEPVASPAEFIATMAGMARGGEREDAAASTRRPSVDIPEELDDIPPPPPPPSDYPSSPPAMPLPPPAKKIRVDAVPARVGSSMASSCSSLDPASRKMLLNIIRRPQRTTGLEVLAAIHAATTDTGIRATLLQEMIREAQRFKKHSLVMELQQEVEAKSARK